MEGLLNKAKIYCKRWFFKCVLSWRRNKNRYFYISFTNWAPKVHINDQYEKLTKWVLRALTAIGIVSSVIAFPQWFFNLLLALFLLGIEQLLERAIFMYFTFYVPAIPKYKPDDWKGMVWLHTEAPSGNYFEVGMMFSSREAAERIFPTIKHWSKDGDNDTSNMVQVSVIINELDYYHVYIYPNVDKDPLYTSTKEKRDREQPRKEHKMSVISIMFCKGFDYSKSSFPRFQKFYHGEFYYLSAYVIENDKPVKLSYLGTIRKEKLKIKMSGELQKTDPEYEHTKYIIDFEKYENEPPPPPSIEFIRR